MRKSRIKMFHSLLLCMMLLCACTGCHAKKHGERQFSRYLPIDTLMRKELGDSISSILLSPKSVCLQRIKVKNDTENVVTSIMLDARDIANITFLVAANDSFFKESYQYSKFSPNVRFIFKKRKSTVIYEIDFGNKLISIKNQNNNLLRIVSISDNKHLKFCLTKFSDDEFLSFLLNK